MSETGVLIGGATLFVFAVFLLGALRVIEALGDRRVDSSQGCILSTLISLIALPIIFAAIIAAFLGVVYVIRAYGG